MKFAYKAIPASPSPAFPEREKVYRPIIPVTIEYQGKKVGYEALLDTGADWNIFPETIGAIIGIDVQNGAKNTFGGIGGGEYVAYFHEVTLYIGGWPIKVLCGFSPDIDSHPHGVLGHVGFFDHCKSSFETRKHEVEIKIV